MGIPRLAQRSFESEPLKIALNEPIVPMVNPNALSIPVDQPILEVPKAPLSQESTE
ncbi:MAG: hypothetical protein HC835_13870 [Oscillatoriales cyanobacterium RM2_1_1]|nr:hypothetical protein [Oscillatoriales cyanobacterium RM2_1_1]